MSRKAVPFVFAAAVVLALGVFFILECPRRAGSPSGRTADLGLVLDEFLSRSEVGASAVHPFRSGDREWHIRVDLTLGRYAALEPALDAMIASTRARVLRKEQERADGTIRFLWKIRGGTGRAAGEAVLLFVCPGEAMPPRPAAETRRGPIAAIIIDDVGYNIEIVRGLAALGRPLTLAVLPFVPHTREAAEAGHAAGLEIMLHLPLESVRGSSDHAVVIGPGMTKENIEARVAECLDQIPWVRGVNNHAGSLATVDPAVMVSILEVVKKRGLYFIDSRTSRDSVAYDAATAAGVPAASRRVFLDQPPGADTVRERLAELFRLAKISGAAAAIGHAREDTIAALRRFLPLVDSSGVRLVFASQIVR